MQLQRNRAAIRVPLLRRMRLVASLQTRRPPPRPHSLLPFPVVRKRTDPLLSMCRWRRTRWHRRKILRARRRSARRTHCNAFVADSKASNPLPRPSPPHSTHGTPHLRSKRPASNGGNRRWRLDGTRNRVHATRGLRVPILPSRWGGVGALRAASLASSKKYGVRDDMKGGE